MPTKKKQKSCEEVFADAVTALDDAAAAVRELGADVRVSVNPKDVK